MTRDELIRQFTGNHNGFIAMVQSLPPAQQAYSYADKWTALQQLKHLVLVLQPLGHVLASKEKIRERFGSINRPVMSFDQLVSTYEQGLGQGGKAPERYLPEAELSESVEELSLSLQALLTVIEKQLLNYAEEELDTLVIPHPFLGNLTIREMFYLMIHHPLHHARQVKEHLTHYPG